MRYSNVNKSLNKSMAIVNYNVNTYYSSSGNMLLLCLKVGIVKLFYSIDTHGNNKSFINPGMKINIFNILSGGLKINRISADVSSIGGFVKLSKFFENNDFKNESAMVAHFNSILKRGNMNSKSSVYIIDPISKHRFPIVYSIYNNNYLFNNNEMLVKGITLIPGNIKFSDYVNFYGFNNFFNYFINTIQEIYEIQGVNVNSKHIEIILRQMTNIIIILEADEPTIIKGKEYEYQYINKLNNYISLLHKNTVLTAKQIIGITNICLNYTTLLSSISFQGTMKSIIEALITGDIYRLDNIKDHIILGKLAPIGTGFPKI